MVTKVKRRNTIHEPSALKTARLFPGCIVGLSGNPITGIDFLQRFKSYINLDNPSGYNWELFNTYASTGGKYIGEEAFELLLSYNGTGCPHLYIYNLRTSRLDRTDDEIVTLGSGREILDPFVKEKYQMVKNSLFDWMIKDKMPIRYYPYFVCLWLCEVAQGTEFSKLEKYGVGGLFHFCFQEAYDEGRQLQSVYVISAVFNNKILHYIYRISFSRGFLIMENPNLKGRYLLTNSIEMPNIKNGSSDQVMRLSKAALNDSDEMPFYRFCGFGFASQEFRNDFIFHIPPAPYEDKDMRVQRDGRIREDILAEITKCIIIRI